MADAIGQLIDLAERLKPTGEIGDGMVAQFHALAQRARFQRLIDEAAIQRGIAAYDAERCRLNERAYGGKCAPMSEGNREFIRPMICAAVLAVLEEQGAQLIAAEPRQCGHGVVGSCSDCDAEQRFV